MGETNRDALNEEEVWRWCFVCHCLILPLFLFWVLADDELISNLSCL